MSATKRPPSSTSAWVMPVRKARWVCVNIASRPRMMTESRPTTTRISMREKASQTRSVECGVRRVAARGATSTRIGGRQWAIGNFILRRFGENSRLEEIQALFLGKVGDRAADFGAKRQAVASSIAGGQERPTKRKAQFVEIVGQLLAVRRTDVIDGQRHILANHLITKSGGQHIGLVLGKLFRGQSAQRMHVGDDEIASDAARGRLVF